MNKAEIYKVLYDSYLFFGLSPNASDKLISSSFKLMILKYHPDHNHKKYYKFCTSMSKKINEAYSFIKKHKKLSKDLVVGLLNDINIKE